MPCIADPDFVYQAMALPSGWRFEFAGKPTGIFFGFHRIDKLDNALVDVITSRTLKRPNVKAGGARGNAGQHGCCLARGARWPRDNHAASPLIRREHNTLSHR
jgi:hypothetical protein